MQIVVSRSMILEAIGITEFAGEVDVGVGEGRIGIADRIVEDAV